MMARVSLTDLPAEVVDRLKSLDHRDYELLGCEAARLRHEDELAAMPKDIKAASTIALDALHADAEVVVTDPDQFVAVALRVIGMALGSGDLDARETADVQQVLDLVADVHRQARAGRDEAHRAIFAATRR